MFKILMIAEHKHKLLCSCKIRTEWNNVSNIIIVEIIINNFRTSYNLTGDITIRRISTTT